MASFPNSSESGRQLSGRIDKALEAARQPLSLEEVEPLIRSIVASMEGDLTSSDLHLYGELEALARYIQRAKSEVASIMPDEITGSHLPTAHDELDAVMGATERATQTIMDACDVIGSLAGKVDSEVGGALTDAITTIFEACNFQDVTGQRITKVVKALKNIENKVEEMMFALGDRKGPPPVSLTEPEPSGWGVDDSGAPLAHGPSLPGQGVDQDEIDRLLASF